MTEQANLRRYNKIVASVFVVGMFSVAALQIADLISSTVGAIALVAIFIIFTPILFVTARKAQAATGKTPTPSQQAFMRYQKRIMFLMVPYLLILFGVVSVFKNGEISNTTAAISAVLPAIPVVGMFWAIGRLLTELDDGFIQMLFVRQTLIATAFSLSLAAVHGFLSSFDVVPKVDAFWWPVLFFLGLFVGQVANRIKYGTWGYCA